MKRMILSLTCVFTMSICKSKPPENKPLKEMVEVYKLGWQTITEWKAAARNKVEILPKDNVNADSILDNSTLPLTLQTGAVFYGCGGILIDDGWIRILGSGCKQLNRNLAEWNKGKSAVRFKGQSSYLLIADDVLGGFFGLCTNAADQRNIGQVFYFGPNSLQWALTGLSYNGFINYCFSGDIQNFYEDFRWNGWKEEVSKLNGSQVISCYPLLWTKEGKELKVNRKVMPIQKLWDLYQGQNKSTASEAPKRSPAKKPAKTGGRVIAYATTGK